MRRLCVLVLALPSSFGATGCAAIGSFLEEFGDDAKETGEEIEDQIDDATSSDVFEEWTRPAHLAPGGEV